MKEITCTYSETKGEEKIVRIEKITQYIDLYIIMYQGH